MSKLQRFGETIPSPIKLPCCGIIDLRADPRLLAALLSADEAGAEAAAATIAKFKPQFVAAGELRPFTMLVNRPFLFAIRHRLTGLLLFASKVCDPGTSS